MDNVEKLITEAKALEARAYALGMFGATRAERMAAKEVARAAGVQVVKLRKLQEVEQCKTW